MYIKCVQKIKLLLAHDELQKYKDANITNTVRDKWNVLGKTALANQDVNVGTPRKGKDGGSVFASSSITTRGSFKKGVLYKTACFTDSLKPQNSCLNKNKILPRCTHTTLTVCGLKLPVTAHFLSHQ